MLIYDAVNEGRETYLSIRCLIIITRSFLKGAAFEGISPMLLVFKDSAKKACHDLNLMIISWLTLSNSNVTWPEWLLLRAKVSLLSILMTSRKHGVNIYNFVWIKINGFTLISLSKTSLIVPLSCAWEFPFTSNEVFVWLYKLSLSWATWNQRNFPLKLFLIDSTFLERPWKTFIFIKKFLFFKNSKWIMYVIFFLPAQSERLKVHNRKRSDQQDTFPTLLPLEILSSLQATAFKRPEKFKVQFPLIFVSALSISLQISKYQELLCLFLVFPGFPNHFLAFLLFTLLNLMARWKRWFTDRNVRQMK